MADRSDIAHRERAGQDAAAEGSTNTAVLRAEIDGARSRMGETIEQIGERLNPNNLKAQVKEDIRHATIGRVENMAHKAADRVDETRRTIGETIRDNPIPAAMVGIGLGWLFINGRRQNDDDGYAGAGRWRSGDGSARELGASGYGGRSTSGYPSGYGRTSEYGSGYGSGQDYASGFGSREGHGEGSDEGRLEHMKERAADLGENARERVSEVGEQISERAHDVAERTQEVAGNVAHRAHELADDVAYRARRQANRVEDRFYESPLVVGALTMAVGVAAGMALPRTRREQEWMGEARENVVHKVRELTEDAKEKVQHVAERVADDAQTTAREAARDEGLTS